MKFKKFEKEEKCVTAQIHSFTALKWDTIHRRRPVIENLGIHVKYGKVR